MIEKKKKSTSVLYFLIGIGAIWFFIFILIPIITHNNKLKIFDQIRNKQIDSGALFYTESEQAVEANFYLIQSDK